MCRSSCAVPFGTAASRFHVPLEAVTGIHLYAPRYSNQGGAAKAAAAANHRRTLECCNHWAPLRFSTLCQQELASLSGASVHTVAAAAARGAKCDADYLWAAAGALRVLHLLVVRRGMHVPAELAPHLHGPTLRLSGVEGSLLPSVV